MPTLLLRVFGLNLDKIFKMKWTLNEQTDSANGAAENVQQRVC